MQEKNAGNLDGIRVVELTHWVSGPLAGQILGEWGADVIHVERPDGGDVTRKTFPFYQGESLYYRTFNRDTRSVTLDVTKPEGTEILLQLIEKADVFITNFTSSFLKKVGLTYEAISARNPRCIVCVISGFGLTGRFRDKKAMDMIMQAMSGQMAVTGEKNGSPMRVGTIIGDYNGAYQAVIGITVALLGRSRTGKGQLVDIAITDSLIAGTEWRIPEYRLTGHTSLRTGNRRPNVSPADLFRTKDGYLYIAASSQGLYEKLRGLIGDERLFDERFSDNTKRIEFADILCPVIEEWTLKHTTAEAVSLCDGAGVPAGPLLTPEDIAKDDYVDEKGLIIEVDDPVLGKIPSMASPIKMTSGYRETHLPAPQLGADNAAVYGEFLGWSGEMLEEMKAKKII